MKDYFSFLSGTVKSYAINGDEPRKFPTLRRFRNTMFLPLGIVVILILAVAFFVTRSASQQPTVFGDEDSRVEVQKPKSSQLLNKSFAFPLKDNSGKEVSKIQYQLLNAELRDEIIVKGKRATAIKGRTFLIINLKITNTFDRTIQINTRDYIRLGVNNNNEKLAPEIHNDPVEIQADSTKYTRIGFPINDTDKNLTLFVGEIKGNKETIKLNLK